MRVLSARVIGTTYSGTRPDFLRSEVFSIFLGAMVHLSQRCLRFTGVWLGEVR